MAWLAVYAAALLTAGIGIGWPWGAVAVAGCIVLPMVTIRVLMRWTMVYRGDPLEQKLLREAVPNPAGAAGFQRLRVHAIRLPPGQVTPSDRPGPPVTARPVAQLPPGQWKGCRDG